MTSAQIAVSNSARKEIRKLTHQQQKRAVAALEKLAHDPRPRGMEKLQGNPDYLRIRAGDLRIVYRLERGYAVILAVRDRKNAYKNLGDLDAKFAHVVTQLHLVSGGNG